MLESRGRPERAGRTGAADEAGAGATREPRYPLEGVVSWNMNTTCNYRCSYCTQRFAESRAKWAADLPRFIEVFTNLPGDWEIKLSGGEPFRHPNFLEAVEALVRGGLRVSVVTNFSASEDELTRFAALTSARPGLLSASLHTEYVTPEAFIERLAWFTQIYRGGTCATMVATRDWLERMPAIKAQFEAAGLVFKVQPEKQDREVIDYETHERELLVQLGGHNGTGRIAPSFYGRPCWAGSRYFIVDHRGEAYRCYPARRYRKDYLGNVLEGTLSLARGAEACAYQYCNCTVPQHRGMVLTD